MTGKTKTTSDPPLHDSYGYPVWRRGRHRLCKCPVPCQQRFQCTAKHHVGHRSTPWCNGAADDKPEWCDTCWAKAQKPEKPFKGVRIRFVD